MYLTATMSTTQRLYWVRKLRAKYRDAGHAEGVRECDECLTRLQAVRDQEQAAQRDAK
jgi:hypothetical protein